MARRLLAEDAPGPGKAETMVTAMAPKAAQKRGSGQEDEGEVHHRRDDEPGRRRAGDDPEKRCRRPENPIFEHEGEEQTPRASRPAP